jgi:hypothetical protein
LPEVLRTEHSSVSGTLVRVPLGAEGITATSMP